MDSRTCYCELRLLTLYQRSYRPDQQAVGESVYRPSSIWHSIYTWCSMSGIYTPGVYKVPCPFGQVHIVPQSLASAHIMMNACDTVVWASQSSLSKESVCWHARTITSCLQRHRSCPWPGVTMLSSSQKQLKSITHSNSFNRCEDGLRFSI